MFSSGETQASRKTIAAGRLKRNPRSESTKDSISELPRDQDARSSMSCLGSSRGDLGTPLMTTFTVRQNKTYAVDVNPLEETF
eukprot:SAG11_NODE_661_length_7885_cov_8.956974_2_plen_83_part_00